jgi:hypothetical protein
VLTSSRAELHFWANDDAMEIRERLLLEIFMYFARAGMFVFGSGLAVAPFLYGGVVDGHHWLTDHQFVDAVAGLGGATAAALGIFLPVYLVDQSTAPSSSGSADALSSCSEMATCFRATSM